MTAATAWRERAAGLFPGGVNSPVRAYRAVGGEPPIPVRGSGAEVWDADGNRYLDYVGAFGPLLLGHAHPAVVGAIREATEAGGSFGTTGLVEVRPSREFKTVKAFIYNQPAAFEQQLAKLAAMMRGYLAARRAAGASAVQVFDSWIGALAVEDYEACVLRERARDILRRAGGRPGHVFNLGHGVLPETPLENLQVLVETIHEWGPVRVG